MSFNSIAYRKHVMAQYEASWTREEAIAWAKNLRGWPSRRYRLERSRAGSSRLVTKWDALNLKSLYGGEVMELIPSAAYHLAKSLKKCPTCKARARRPCKTSAGAKRRPHKNRWAVPA